MAVPWVMSVLSAGASPATDCCGKMNLSNCAPSDCTFMSISPTMTFPVSPGGLSVNEIGPPGAEVNGTADGGGSKE